MINKLLPFCYLMVLFVFLACEDEDVPVLTGDIKGTVHIYDGYGYPLQDKSGVRVQLINPETLMEKTTDEEGRYSFENIAFGNYQINLIKENYIESILDFHLNHAGGEAATITSQTLNEIPEYRFAIDSIVYNGFNRLFLYFEAIETNKNIESYYVYVHCFFSQSPDVSSENYENSFIIRTSNISGTNKFTDDWWWWNNSYNFLNNYTGTIYCRVYIQTYCYEMWPEIQLGPHEVIPETLGKSSEVFAFTVE